MTINAAKMGLAVLKCCHCGVVKPSQQMPAFCHHCMGPVCTQKPCMMCSKAKNNMESRIRQAETSRHYDQFTAH